MPQRYGLYLCFVQCRQTLFDLLSLLTMIRTSQLYRNHKIVVPCRCRSANQTSTECCLEVTALARLSNVPWAVWVRSSPSHGSHETSTIPRSAAATKAWRGPYTLHPCTGSLPKTKNALPREIGNQGSLFFHATCHQAFAGEEGGGFGWTPSQGSFQVVLSC